MNVFEAVLNNIEAHSSLDTLGMGLMLTLCVRLVLATNAHPRIALITETMRHSASDMFHFMMIFLLVFVLFVLICSWRFGSRDEDVADFWNVFYTQFNALLGPPGALEFGRFDDTEYFMYCLLFHSICFFFMVNFV